MKLLLTHAYYLEADPKEQQIMKPYAPLGLLYVSGYLKDRGVEHRVYDCTFTSFEQQLQTIQEEQPDLIAIYANMMTKPQVVTLMQLLRNDARFGFPKIVLGGPDVTYNLENYLQAGAHYLVIGEGEQSLFELYQTLKAKDPIEQVSGIAYLEDGMVHKNPPRVKMKDLSSLPLPNRSAIDMHLYLDAWKTHHGSSSMTISTQRGCPYTCKWCSTAVYGQSYRRRPAEAVVDEMLMLRDTYNPDSLWFVDDVFTVSHKWLSAFHEEVIRRDAVIPFECITRAERLNPEILEKLKAAGCYRIWIGAESGSQRIIDAMDRRVAVETVQQAIQDANTIGMETGTFIMLGYPGETEADIRQTIHHLKRANPTHFTITVAYPIKGTALYEEVEGTWDDIPVWNESTDRDIYFKRTYRKPFYPQAVRRVVNEVKAYQTDRLDQWLKFKLKSTLALCFMKFHKYRPI